MSDIPAMTRRQRVEEREHAIIAAARAVFVEHGYDGARMAEIARRAGIAEGTVYLYFKTKVDLMKAIVADFWRDLTLGARKATRGHDDTFEALHALAEFHLTMLMDRFDVVELTQNLRMVKADPSSSRQYLKTYVAVFDEIFRRGVDRTELAADASVWAARDVFYGGLEYSARTLLVRGERHDGTAVNNMLRVFRAAYGRGKVPREEGAAAGLLGRLEAAVERLEQQAAKAEDQPSR